MKFSETFVRALLRCRILLLGLLSLVLQGPAFAQFVAYNDHAPGAGTSANTTTWNIFGASPGSTGNLKDSTTGATLPVVLTITTVGSVSPAGTQGAPAAGTPLYNAFNGFVDFQGTPSPSVELNPGGVVNYTFTGLNPNKRYSFMGSAVRGVATYTDRWTLFEISGAASFTSAHTKNVLTTAQVPTISPNQGAINTGVNFTADTGDMVVWENIDPGAEGSFSVTCQQYTDDVPNGSSAGIKGYGMTGIRLEEFDATKTPVAITNQPLSQTVAESQPVSFTVGASGNPAPTFQWYTNDFPISGATNATYSISAAAFAQDNLVFKVIAANTISNVNYTQVSSNAVLHVIADTNAPTVVSVQPLGLNQLRVVFSERVTLNSATNLANYSIASDGGSITISNVVLEASESSVLMNVGTLTENINYTLSLAGITDQSAAANQMAATQKIFAAITYAPLDIGSPTIAGGITAVQGGYDLRGAGADIGGLKDQFQFGYQTRSGDFDIRVRVADLAITDPYVKAGLMARETLTNNARFAAVFASSAQLGLLFEQRSTAGATATTLGPTPKFPADYPWAWLRLQRTGNTFFGYGSFDGKAWQQLGTVTIAMPTDIYFGLATTSGYTNTVTTAKFRDIGPTSAPTAFTYVPSRESIGPSNRRTGLMFSEIMYDPKARADGKVLDFVEIFNGDSTFIDLTGWKITGGIDYAFPAGFRINAGQFVVIASDTNAMQSVYGISGVLGPYTKNLGDSDTLKLSNASGALRAEVKYSAEQPWPVSPDGAGHSLVCLRPSYGEEDPRAWGPSQLIGGSPGYDDPIVANPWAGVVINEFLALSPALSGGFVELYNASNGSVDLSGCILTDDPSTNKFKIADLTHLGSRTWISFSFQQLGFSMPSAGGSLYLIAADGSRVLDAIRVGGQEVGVSMGRVPDGAPGIRRLASPTPGQLNSGLKQESVVINELMYAPISDDPDDQYIELYNRTSSAIDVGGWRFVSGVDFSIPAGTSIPANGYLVVARNLARMLTNYSQLNRTNTVGDFSGKLSGGGERVALAKPGGGPSEYITVSEVSYMAGGRWPELANGGGSSLELRDARSDLSLAGNWAASDETQKASWATYQTTGPLNLAHTAYAANFFYIMAEGGGEYLIDDVEVLNSGGTNVLTNPGFESGAGGWTSYGTQIASSLQTGGANSGANCFHIRATEVGDEGPNSTRGTLSNALLANSSVTLRARVRWLAGWPEILLRVRGNGIELPIQLQIPKNLGTPGLPNSARVANAGPAISEVTHYPTLPALNQSVLVTARISDPDGLGAPQLIYRADPSTTTSTVLMHDDGTAGDALAGDGIYSGIIPARTTATTVAFRIQAQDSASTPATSLFPNNAPTRECFIRWGDANPFGSFGNYHLWSSAASATAVNSGPGLDRLYRDCTVVYDTRTIYNAGWRNKGSPFHSGRGSYSLGFSDDDLFMGTDKHVLRCTGNGGDEGTEMAGAMAYWIGERMGLQFNNTRYARLYYNGTLHNRIDYDIEVPDRAIAKDWFGGGGLDDTLYKITGWFEFDDSMGGGTSGVIWSTIDKKPTTAPPYKTAAYRFNYAPHPGGRTANNYSLIFNLAGAANATDKVTGLMNLADMENWMRVWAHRRLCGDWDSWSYRTGQNMYMYAPLGERAKLLSWDMDFVLGLGDGPGSNLFTAGQDGVVQSLMNVPTYHRMMMRAFQDAVKGPLQSAVSDPFFDARYSILVKNGISPSVPTGLKSYVTSERATLDANIKGSDTANFTITTAGFTTSTPTATINGTAPIGVASIEVNGIPYPVSWTGNLTWSIKVPLGAVTNVLQIVGKDLRGNIYNNTAVAQITVNYTGAVPQAKDWIVINEIMYNATISNAEFVEIYNSNPTYTFDLSGYRMKGIDFDFPAGALIQPNGYMVIVKDSAAFAGAYGATIPIVGGYSGKLDNTGEVLTLVKPGATSAQDIVVDQVHYQSSFPWPELANGFGPSLQLIDATQDNSRAGNWAVSSSLVDTNRATPGRANSIKALVNPFPQLWINEVLPTNVAGATDALGEHDPWIEIYNAGSTTVDLSTCYLSDTGANPNLWQFPAGTSIAPGQFLVVWADGQPDQTTATEIHASFRLSASGGLVALGRLQNGAVANLDYMYYPGTSADQSYGSIAEGDIENRRLLFLPTPGAANNPGNLMVPVFINEWMSSNTKTLADPADNDFDDWFELYNNSANTVDLTDYFLTQSATNTTGFKIPAGYTIPPHGYLLVWADNETTQNATNRADLHVNFKLSKAGDTIALYTPNGAQIDAVTFPAQNDNVSSGRYPDGANSFFIFTTSTPRAANSAPPGTRFTQIAWNGAQLTISWITTANHTYRIESKSDLNQALWTQVGVDQVATGGTMSMNIDVTATSIAFFRVVQVD